MHKESFNPCPICNKTDIAHLLHTKDYSLTNESFEIINEITQEDLDDIASGHHGYPHSSYLDEEEKEYVFLL